MGDRQNFFNSIIGSDMVNVGILLTCPMTAYIQEELAKRFRLFKFWEAQSKEEFLSQHWQSIHAIVGNGVHGADAQLIDALPNLEIVSSHSSGLNQIDLERCREKGIRVTYTPDVLTDDVADMAILLTLAVFRRICDCDRFVRSGAWNNGSFKLTTRFSGKSVGIIGLGRIGSAIAKRAEAFGCPISYYSRYERPDSKYKYYSNVVSLSFNCEILIIACALNDATRRIVDRKVIDALGPNGVIVNIGRGFHIDEPELISALVEGRLSGAGLNVFEDETNVPEQLRRLDNVVLSPHCATATVETRKAMADLAIANLEAHFQNKPLLTPVI